MIFRLLLLYFLVALLPSLALAAERGAEKPAEGSAGGAVETVAQGELTEKPFIPGTQEKKLLAEISRYFQVLGSVKSEIIQKNPDGSEDRGVLYLALPGRLRLDYHPPQQTVLIATGIRIFLVDKALEELSVVAQDRTPIALLIRKKIDFLAPDVIIHNMRVDASRISVMATQKKFRESGSIEFIFERKPLRLKAWRVIDSSSEYDITVNIAGFEKTPAPDSSFFTLKNIWKKPL